MAVAANGQVNMTVAFDPTLPSPSARASVDRLLRLIRNPGDGLTRARLLESLEAAPLRQQFYREIDAWTRRLQQSKSLEQRQAVMRHLVRVMFSWILKEESIIPPELFEEGFVKATLTDAEDYHRGVLGFLFHSRLNVDLSYREPFAGSASIADALDKAPFLNGSLFAMHADDEELAIPASGYWNTDPEQPGLFTILSRYHWTMDEHRPGESEQTLDPELLSNLFERLIVPTQEGEAAPDRQPQGTYYTPADVADEMVKDALAAAVRNQAPSSMSESDLLDLFGDSDASLPAICDGERRSLARRIKELRIFDPAVGSGEFLFSVLVALRRALGKLEPDEPSPAEDIIKRQLAGQDINPLAVQIARLRLFIAIIAARKNSTPQSLRGQSAPLPNLEARIVCADSLETRADPLWRPERPGGQLESSDAEVASVVVSISENRASWYGAHSEEEKDQLKSLDAELRDRLRLRLHQLNLVSPELSALTESPLFDVNPFPARTDARLLFYEEPWRGFDIVIGNPPYEALSKSMDPAKRKRLADEKGYQTVNANDLYTLFCEIALAIADPDGGVVTLIVPLSIAFGHTKQTIRNLFNRRCDRINLRHYNNRPDTTFNASPTVKTPENRQRATVITGILGSTSRAQVYSTGLQSWPVEERGPCLQRRRTARLPLYGQGVHQFISGQWPRIPTEEVGDLITALLAQKPTVSEYQAADGENLAFPLSAYHFVSVIREGTVSPRGERLLTVSDIDDLRLIVATLNGHVAFGWWWSFGDGFHVKSRDFSTMTVPNAWVDDPQPAIEIGRRLLDIIPKCIVENHQQGKTWRNVDFHTYAPDLIEELDRLHIEALGLPVEPLLTHLRIMRSSSSWNFPE